MCEINEPNDAVDHGVAQSDERDEGAVGQAVKTLLDKELPTGNGVGGQSVGIALPKDGEPE